MVGGVISLRGRLFSHHGRKGRVNLIPAVNTLRRNRTSLMGHDIRRGNIAMISIFLGPARFGSGNSLRHCPHALSTSYGLLRTYNTSCIFTPSMRRVCPAPSAHRFRFPPMDAIVRNTGHPNRFGNMYRMIDHLFCVIYPAHTCFKRGS